MALQLQQKLLITSVSLFPASLVMAYVASRFESDQSNDPATMISLMAIYTLPLLGLFGIVLCAVFWKWPDSKT